MNKNKQQIYNIIMIVDWQIKTGLIKDIQKIEKKITICYNNILQNK